MMPSTCGPEIKPLEPKPPPRNGLRMWMFSGAMPNSPAMRALRHRQALARRVDRQPVAVPRGHDRVRLHRVVVLRRRLVGRLDALRRRGEPGLDIAAMHLGGIADADRGRHEALAASSPTRAGSVS